MGGRSGLSRTLCVHGFPGGIELHRLRHDALRSSAAGTRFAFMFEFFFKYPMPVFSKGKFVLLGAWPGWVLVLLIVVCMGGLAALIWQRLKEGTLNLNSWRGSAV